MTEINKRKNSFWLPWVLLMMLVAGAFYTASYLDSHLHFLGREFPLGLLVAMPFMLCAVVLMRWMEPDLFHPLFEKTAASKTADIDAPTDVELRYRKLLESHNAMAAQLRFLVTVTEAVVLKDPNAVPNDLRHLTKKDLSDAVGKAEALLNQHSKHLS